MQVAIMDRVFIKPDEKKQGAIITLTDDDETKSGVVTSVGERVSSVKVGNHVVYYKLDDLPAMDGLVAVKEQCILGLIEDE